MPLSRCASVLLIAVCAFAPATFVRGDDAERPAADEPSAESLKFFESKVRPLLVAHCQKCHGEKQQKGKLRLDSIDAVLKGGATGPALVRGKPEESPLVEAINYRGLEMPPDGKLPEAEIAILTAWIKGGAPWPENAKARSRAESAQITDADRSFWSFQPPRDPPVPAIADAGWARNGIDRFIGHKLQAERMTPSPEADRRTLIRRLSFDLIGLPPTPEEIDAFVADGSPTAYEELVDRLLASPRYGERWGRHWLDLARYAESNGHGGDQYRPNAWRYRDYVVRSFNEDKPYDRFILEQLAGDEIAPDDPDAMIATGFLRHWTYESNQRKTREVRDVYLTDVTDTTGDVFLGMGLGCARCHDHKFDPILQKDYYRIQSFFAAMLPRDDIPIAKPNQIAALEAKRKTWEEQTADIRKELAVIESPLQEEVAKTAFGMYPQEIKDMYRKPSGERSPLEQVLVALVEQQLQATRTNAASGRRADDATKSRLEALNKKLAEFKHAKPAAVPVAMVVTDIGPQAPVTTLPGKEDPLEPGFLSVIDAAPANVKPVPSAPNSTGRRTALAKWIASPGNPLTARVMVNRLWQYHFGRGLAATTSDFGRLGERPTHPELLDWLTSRFLEGGWRIKSMHRLIVTSATYRQSAVVPSSEMALRKDPQNAWLWRMNIRRLEAEPIFDTMLAVAGDVDLSMGGPSVETSAHRRTLYNRIVRNTPDPLLRAFDSPDGFISTPQRDESTTVTQALMLINGDWALERAQSLAKRLMKERSPNDPEQLVTRANRLVYGRDPEPNELARGIDFLRKKSTTDESKATEITLPALVDYCHVLLNSNEFLYVD